MSKLFDPLFSEQVTPQDGNNVSLTASASEETAFNLPPNRLKQIFVGKFGEKIPVFFDEQTFTIYPIKK